MNEVLARIKLLESAGLIRNLVNLDSLDDTYTHLAIDANGSAWVYQAEPQWNGDIWNTSINGEVKHIADVGGNNHTDYEDSVIKLIADEVTP